MGFKTRNCILHGLWREQHSFLMLSGSQIVFLVDVTEKFDYRMRHCKQGCGVGVARSRGFLGGVGVGFLITPEAGFFHPTPEVQLNHLLHRTPKLRILTRACWNGTTSFETFNETDNSSVHHDFHWLVFAAKLLTAKLPSRYVKKSVSENFGS